MEEPVVKGDGKIVFSFKDNQCIVETEYAQALPPAPTPAPPPVVLSRETQTPFHQTIVAGSPQGHSWMTSLIVFQSISMIVGIFLLVGIGVYLVNRSQESEAQLTKTQMQIHNQEGTIDQLQVELRRLSEDLKRFEHKEKYLELEKKEQESTPQIETNLNK
jgi:hypothetical protein